LKVSFFKAREILERFYPERFNEDQQKRSPQKAAEKAVVKNDLRMQ
jgi:hypothetical protein